LRSEERTRACKDIDGRKRRGALFYRREESRNRRLEKTPRSRETFRQRERESAALLKEKKRGTSRAELFEKKRRRSRHPGHAEKKGTIICHMGNSSRRRERSVRLTADMMKRKKRGDASPFAPLDEGKESHTIRSTRRV